LLLAGAVEVNALAQEAPLSVPAHVYIREQKMCTGCRVMYIYVLNENPGFMALEVKPMSHFCGSSVFWKLGYRPNL